MNAPNVLTDDDCTRVIRESSQPVSLSPQLADLSDAELLLSTRRLVGASNQLLAALLAHLAEIEARGVHRIRACASVYTYCIYELQLSEDAAFRRVSAARLVRRFPQLFDAIASGELHLTAVLLLGPHLTAENLAEVLARAKHRTKKEICKLVRELDPMPDVPARIEPLGPASSAPPPRAPRATWQAFMLALNPVRHLAPGERPRAWMSEELAGGVAAATAGSPPVGGVVGVQVAEVRAAADAASAERWAPSAPARKELTEDAALPRVELADDAALGRVELALEFARLQPKPLAGPQRYKVQFTASAEHIELVERAQALLSSSRDGAALVDVYERALRELVIALEKRKYAAGTRPRRSAKLLASQSEGSGFAGAEQAEDTAASQDTISAAAQRPRGRYIPAAVRREVFERDGARCTFVESTGQRCRETHGLELHHVLAFARGGEHRASNLTLRCRAHNALAAEEDFGRQGMEDKRALGHEPFRAG